MKKVILLAVLALSLIIVPSAMGKTLTSYLPYHGHTLKVVTTYTYVYGDTWHLEKISVTFPDGFNSWVDMKWCRWHDGVKTTSVLATKYVNGPTSTTWTPSPALFAIDPNHSANGAVFTRWADLTWLLATAMN